MITEHFIYCRRPDVAADLTYARMQEVNSSKICPATLSLDDRKVVPEEDFGHSNVVEILWGVLGTTLGMTVAFGLLLLLPSLLWQGYSYGHLAVIRMVAALVHTGAHRSNTTSICMDHSGHADVFKLSLCKAN